jgi:hypothetical protein
VAAFLFSVDEESNGGNSRNADEAEDEGGCDAHAATVVGRAETTKADMGRP